MYKRYINSIIIIIQDSRLQVTDGVNLKTTVLWGSMAIF